MKPFQWGFIGSGHIVRKVARTIAQTEQHSISKIYSRNINSSKLLAEKYNAIVCDSVDEMLNSSEIDGVYIATPQSSHYQYITKCLSARKPVFCEKPAVINVKQLNHCIDIAQKNGVYFSSVMSYKYGPAYIKLKNIIKNGSLGQMKSIYADFGYDVAAMPKRVRLIDPDCAGGVLFEMGVYLVSFANDLCGNLTVDSVKSEILANGVDIYDEFRLTDSNVNCDLVCSFKKVLTAEAKLSFENAEVILPAFYRGCHYNIEYYNGEKEMCEYDFSYQNQFDVVIKEIRDNRIQSERNSFDSMRKELELLDSIRKKGNIIYPSMLEQIIL